MPEKISADKSFRFNDNLKIFASNQIYAEHELSKIENLCHINAIKFKKVPYTLFQRKNLVTVKQ